MSQLNITSIKNKRGDFGPNLVGYSTVTGDLNVTGNLKVGGGVTVSGITTFSGDISFDSDVSIGGTLTASDVSIGGTLGVDGDVSIGNSIKLYPSTGIVTAVYFYGDGSNLENLPASAGLGTVLSEDETSPLNKIYYTDQVLAIGSTVTVNPPDSAQVAYTQYAQIVLNDDADLIVAPGDDFIPDILGIGTTGVGSGTLTGDGGRVRADNLTNRAGTGAPNASNGLIVTGVVTATTGSFSGNVSIGGTLTYEDVTNVDSVGLVTARTGVRVLAGGVDISGGGLNITGVTTATGNVLPDADATYNLGGTSNRWANIYSADLQLSNEGSANDVDGTWGQYTIQEGEHDLFLINRRSGKKYKFNLTEVN